MFATNLMDAFGGLVAFGYWEIAICVGVFVLLFGSAKLPQLFRNMGRSVNEFKAGMNTTPSSIEDDSADAETPQKETVDA